MHYIYIYIYIYICTIHVQICTYIYIYIHTNFIISTLPPKKVGRAAGQRPLHPGWVLSRSPPRRSPQGVLQLGPGLKDSLVKMKTPRKPIGKPAGKMVF